MYKDEFKKASLFYANIFVWWLKLSKRLRIQIGIYLTYYKSRMYRKELKKKEKSSEMKR